MRELLRPDAPVARVPGRRADLLRLLLEAEMAAVPVVKDGSRKLVGVVGRSDLLAHPDEDQTSLLMDPNPSTTYPEATLVEAASLLTTSRRPMLCVVSGSNDLLGVLDPARLLARFQMPRGLLVSHLPHAVVPVHQATPAPVALEILRATGARALPVLDDEGHYAGLVTDGDLLRRAEVRPVVHSQGDAWAQGDPWSWETSASPPVHRHGTRLALPRTAVGEFADRRAPTLAPTAPLEAGARLVQEGRRSLPVVDVDGHVQDLVTDLDLLRIALAARA